jgi:phosphate transport system protein
MTAIDEETNGFTIAETDRLVIHLFAMVADGLAKATAAFLDHDREAARRLIAADTELDTLQEEVEELVERELATRGQDDGNLPFLLSVLRIVPELERSGDLVEHIALRTAHGLVPQLSPEARSLIQSMANVGVEMWQAAADAYAHHDPDAAEGLRAKDDILDDLHVSLTAELSQGTLPPAAAIEMGLLARFYERLGDHAVNVTRKVRPVTQVVRR